MPWTYTEDSYREYTRTSWNQSADSYGRFMELLLPFRTALVDAVAARQGESILDLGTGPGEPALTIASSVAPGGRVLGVDLSERMVALASATARSRGLPNAEFRAMDSSRLDLPDGQFDAVVSNFGFQIFTDPEAAAREAHRVLRPHGRIAVTIWARGDRVPFLDALIAPMLQHAEPDENGYIPTPYEIGGPGEMVGFLGAAGFREGLEATLSHTVHFPNADAYLDTLLRGTPIGHSLSEESPVVQAEVLAAARRTLAAATGPTGIDLRAECLLVTARA
ncbi:MAG: methyltransferase domain-containing protein [Thermoplasmata archaeon]|nr:methyltransferase domain-containing protein [Thermoplasmata archaeon]